MREKPSGFRGHAARVSLSIACGKNLRQFGGQVLGRHANLGGELLYGVGTKRLVNLVGSHGLVGARPHPGRTVPPSPCCSSCGNYPLNAAMLFDEPIDHGCHFGADHSTQYSVEQSH